MRPFSNFSPVRFVFRFLNHLSEGDRCATLPVVFFGCFSPLLVRGRPSLHVLPTQAHATELAPLINAEHVEMCSAARCAACARFSDAPGSASFQCRTPRPRALGKSARTSSPPSDNSPELLICKRFCRALPDALPSARARAFFELCRQPRAHGSQRQSGPAARAAAKNLLSPLSAGPIGQRTHCNRFLDAAASLERRSAGLPWHRRAALRTPRAAQQWAGEGEYRQINACELNFELMSSTFSRVFAQARRDEGPEGAAGGLGAARARRVAFPSPQALQHAFLPQHQQNCTPLDCVEQNTRAQ